MMNWQSLDQFLHMGGYGLYVWGSYAVTLAVMVAEAVLVRRRNRTALAAARAETLMEAQR
jgi:heme exporter protein D